MLSQTFTQSSSPEALSTPSGPLIVLGVFCSWVVQIFFFHFQNSWLYPNPNVKCVFFFGPVKLFDSMDLEGNLIFFRLSDCRKEGKIYKGLGSHLWCSPRLWSHPISVSPGFGLHVKADCGSVHSACFVSAWCARVSPSPPKASLVPVGRQPLPQAQPQPLSYLMFL